MGTSIKFTRINNDVNGNPRYVCHFLNLIKPTDISTTGFTNDESAMFIYGISKTEYDYQRALKKAKTIGGKKFHNKQYGGGIVFQSYNLPDLEKSIFELQNA